jgi:simple sugar transport system ATP-binding protein
MPYLTMTGITKQFFGKAANDAVDFSLERGEIHALLGENGAGKTTLMNILYGIYQMDAGSIHLDGKIVNIKSPKDALGLHIGMVHQHFTLVPTLTVRENITLGLKSPGYPFVHRNVLDEEISALSERYALSIDPKALVGQLSVGQQQRVEIMKALYRKTDLLILDEPTAVLTPSEAEGLFAVLHQLAEEGHSVIIITHHIDEVLHHTDRVTILRNARNIQTVLTDQTNEQELSQLMIGRKVQKTQHRISSSAVRQPALVLDGIQTQEGMVGPLSLTLHAGSIVGIAGVDGNGQTELAEAIMGIRKLSKGSVHLDGVDLTHLSIQQRRQKGIAYISDDRHRDGLVLDMDLRENLLLSFHQKPSLKHHHLLDRTALDKATEQAVACYGIKTASLSCPLRYLSGGNQQKLILARELADDPKVVIACQPTRGLDIGCTEEVHKTLLTLRSQGCAVLLLSFDLEEILAISDRIGVLYKGTLMDVFENEQVDLTRLGLLMAGLGNGRLQ